MTICDRCRTELKKGKTLRVAVLTDMYDLCEKCLTLCKQELKEFLNPPTSTPKEGQ